MNYCFTFITTFDNPLQNVTIEFELTQKKNRVNRKGLLREDGRNYTLPSQANKLLLLRQMWFTCHNIHCINKMNSVLHSINWCSCISWNTFNIRRLPLFIQFNCRTFAIHRWWWWWIFWRVVYNMHIKCKSIQRVIMHTVSIASLYLYRSILHRTSNLFKQCEWFPNISFFALEFSLHVT